MVKCVDLNLTDVSGSGVGKTQLLLALLLSVQLPDPYGTSRSALYISTESPLPTTRLAQMLLSHPTLLAADPPPSLDRVISIVTPDLESQDHILRFQLPVAIRRHNVGLVVLDSVAANYRAEFERPGASRSGAHMAKRSSELVKLGQLLRELARKENIAIVIANQVSDRFAFEGRPSGRNSPRVHATQSSPLANRSGPGINDAPPSSFLGVPASSMIAVAKVGNQQQGITKPTVDISEAMTLDHQQRWFTGWGDEPREGNMKTPSLGLIWTCQIACRIALIKRPVFGPGIAADEENERGETVLKRWRRWLKVVFAPWAPASAAGRAHATEFEITKRGIKSRLEPIAAACEEEVMQ